ncbi:MAG: hypothetical protein AB1894_04740 [Chloroflexota bacterium]
MHTANSSWKPLYQIGAIAALLAAYGFRRSISAELSLFNGCGLFAMPPAMPATAAEWFALFQSDGLLGLALLDFFDLVEYALVGLMFTAIYVALERTRRSAALLALLFGLTGITVAFASNRAFGMLSLSQQYAAATTEARRAALLSAGEALLGSGYNTGWFVGLFLVLLAGMIFSILMLRSPVFGKTTAWMGILASGFGMLLFPTFILAPTLLWIGPSLSAPFRLIWYTLIAIKLLRNQ